jgi:hypothetical protein
MADALETIFLSKDFEKHVKIHAKYISEKYILVIKFINKRGTYFLDRNNIINHFCLLYFFIMIFAHILIFTLVVK